MLNKGLIKSRVVTFPSLLLSKRNVVQHIKGKKPSILTSSPASSHSTNHHHIIDVPPSEITQPIQNIEKLNNVRVTYNYKQIDISKIDGKKIYGTSKRSYDTRSVILEPAFNKYVVYFSYGPIVFFNLSEQEQEKYYKDHKELYREPLDESIKQVDYFQVSIDADLDDVWELDRDRDIALVKQLDSHVVSIVSGILAQSVALDALISQLNEMFDKFEPCNTAIKLGGVFPDPIKQEVHNLIFQKNKISTELLRKIGALEGTDASWDRTEMDGLWRALRSHWDIGHRINDIQTKSEELKSQLHFTMDAINQNKTTRLEIWIIRIIGAELFLAASVHLFDHWEAIHTFFSG